MNEINLFLMYYLSMIEIYKKKFFKYFISDKKSFWKYFSLSFFVGLVELFGVALTYPFVNSLISNQGDFNLKTIILGTTIIVAFLAKNVFMIFYSSLQANFVRNSEASINKKFIKYFIYSNYQNVASMTFNQKTQFTRLIIPNTINNYLLRLLNLNVNIFIFVLITAFLFIKFFIATLITLLCSLLLLFSQALFFKLKTKKLASKIEKVNEAVGQAHNEALMNLKNIKILQKEDYFYKKYCDKLDEANEVAKQTLFYNTIPPYITEPLIIILLMLLLVIITMQNLNSPNELVASYALIVSAIFRLAPTLSRIQVNLTGINTCLPMVETLIEAYERFGLDNLPENPYIEKVNPFKNSIKLNDVYFSYSDKDVLKAVSIEINKGEFLGIAGMTGSGKTTLIDILSGVLNIKSGELYLDGKFINDTKMPPLKIGYIPQDYTIIKGSIRENVALGEANIQDEKVIDALKKAQLYEFIEKEFKEGIYAKPFVDSVGFSQGQKQRLIIARALYFNPDIIILDEATSSLDLKTEDEFCSVLNELRGEKTIIAIAHRLSTIKNADRIIFMKAGKVDSIGTFDALYSSNSEFKELVELNSTNPIH